jgi:hypothetical protein
MIMIFRAVHPKAAAEYRYRHRRVERERMLLNQFHIEGKPAGTLAPRSSGKST